MPPIKDWEKPVPLDQVDVERVAREVSLSSHRVMEALRIINRDIFDGPSLEKDLLRRECKKLNEAPSIGHARAHWWGYKRTLDAKIGNLDPSNTSRIANPEIVNLYIWYFSHRYKLSPKSAK